MIIILARVLNIYFVSSFYKIDVLCLVIICFKISKLRFRRNKQLPISKFRYYSNLFTILLFINIIKIHLITVFCCIYMHAEYMI